MKPITQPDSEFERRPSPSLWETGIRVALIAALAVLCFQVFSPFLHLTVWSMILAITMYPAHQWLARRMGGRQGLTSIIMVILGVSLIVVPTWLLVNSFADSVQRFVTALQQNTVQIPAPREGLKQWPIVGPNIYDTWSKAHSNLPALAQSMQPKLADLARRALKLVSSLAGADPAAWRGVKMLRTRPDLLSARVGIHHRLLMRLDPGAGSLEVVHFIHRRELEETLRRG